MTIQNRAPRFFVTSESPCSYLPGRTERKVFAELRGPEANGTNEVLARIGFRRSQTVAYRPSCLGCQACVAVRVVTAAFNPSRSQQRVMRRYASLSVSGCEPWATQEQYELMQRYLGARHPEGGMARMDAHDFADMVEATTVDTLIVEYRRGTDSDDPGELVGVSLTDRQSDGLSMVYSFFDPDMPGLGSFMILDHISRAAAARLPYVYLGYWVKNSPRMAYKARFAPLEALTPEGWFPLAPGLKAGFPPSPPADSAIRIRRFL
ncbi:arginyltransferase [Sandaracinobacteroides saxicola]|uniref:Aspartate/glutamate leucyltransferase n=1 Tax=Sandaracinobacteroides saxicola TaxID=2759707 RepID=A0A7G5ILU3_9SPHN|nr:arginyltransferase [Sandaracinobacteroides saxicola]QMW24335.1 arginyltransferase [Sandaracinobacteroides saxicola]